MKKKAVMKLLSFGLAGAMALTMGAVPGTIGASVVYAEESTADGDTDAEASNSGEAAAGEQDDNSNTDNTDSGESEDSKVSDNTGDENTDSDEQKNNDESGVEDTDNTDEDQNSDTNDASEDESTGTDNASESETKDNTEGKVDTENNSANTTTESQDSTVTDGGENKDSVSEDVSEEKVEFDMNTYQVKLSGLQSGKAYKLYLYKDNKSIYNLSFGPVSYGVFIENLANNIVESGTYKVELKYEDGDTVLAATESMEITVSEKLAMPSAPKVEFTKYGIKISGEYTSDNSEYMLIKLQKDGDDYYSTTRQYIYQNGSYEKYYTYDNLKNDFATGQMKINVQVQALPNDTSKNSVSDFSDATSIEITIPEESTSPKLSFNEEDKTLTISNKDDNEAYRICMVSESGANFYFYFEKGNTESTTTSCAKFINESGKYWWHLMWQDQTLDTLEMEITVSAPKLDTPKAPSAVRSGNSVIISGECNLDNADNVYIGIYDAKTENLLTTLTGAAVKDGKYSYTYTSNLGKYYPNVYFKAKAAPEDASKNSASDWSTASEVIDITYIEESSNAGGSSSGDSNNNDSDTGSTESSSASTTTAAASTPAAAPAEGVAVEKAAPGAKVQESSVAVGIAAADGTVSTVDLKTYLALSTENIINTIAQDAAAGTDASVTLSNIMTAPVSEAFTATINALGGSSDIVNCGTVRTAATAYDTQGNLIASAGKVKNVTKGALVLLMSVNEDGSVDYVEGVVDDAGNVLGIFNGVPKTISVLVIVPATV